MKLVNNKLQIQMENLEELKSKEYFKDYLKTILEDQSTPYYKRCDYVGLSLQELKFKIDTLAKDIGELQKLRQKLSSALNIAKEITAEVFEESGIDRIDGNVISSLTVIKSTTKTKNSIRVLRPNEVMSAGFVKFEPDIESITQALKTKEGQKELLGMVEVSTATVVTPSKVKINTKRSSSANLEVEEINTIEHKEAA